MALHRLLFAAQMDFTITTVHLTFTSSPMELCRNFTIEDDLVVEEPQEQFGLTLFTSDLAVIFSRETASVTIIDNDSTCIWGYVKWFFARHVLRSMHIKVMRKAPRAKDVQIKPKHMVSWGGVNKNHCRIYVLSQPYMVYARYPYSAPWPCTPMYMVTVIGHAAPLKEHSGRMCVQPICVCVCVCVCV